MPTSKSIYQKNLTDINVDITMSFKWSVKRVENTTFMSIGIDLFFIDLIINDV